MSRSPDIRALLRRTDLSPTGAAAVGAASAAVALAASARAPALSLLGYGALLAVLAAWLVTRRAPAVEVVRSGVPARLVAGQEVEVTLVVRARRGMGAVVLAENLSPQLGPEVRFAIPALRRGAEHELTYRLRPRRRGRCVVGPLALEWSDPFGLTDRSHAFGPADELIVHPAVDPAHDRALARRWEDPPIRPPELKPWPVGFEFYGLRDYVPGDDLRQIVWSAVARSGRLLVRESEQGITDRVVLVLDTAAAGHSPGDPSATFERGVGVTAALADRYLHDGFAVSLLLPGGDVHGRGPGSRTALLDALACVQADEAGMGETGTRLMTLARQGVHAVVVAPRLDSLDATRLRLCIERGSSVTFAGLMGHSADVQMLSRAAAVGCEVVRVDPSGPLGAMFQRQFGAGMRG